jgi:hypothetical protein
LANGVPALIGMAATSNPARFTAAIHGVNPRV